MVGCLLGTRFELASRTSGSQIVGRVSGLYRLGAEPNPYFQPSEGWLLYFFDSSGNRQ